MSLSKTKEFDLQYKVIVIGETAVGKSSLIRRYANPEQPFTSNMISTVGIDFVNVDTKVDDLTVRLQIWDTAGQERFRTMTKSQFRGTKGVLLVYDITKDFSYDQLQFWIKSIKESKLDHEEFLIVGNKYDLNDEREVPKTRGEELAKSLGVKYMETSAKTGRNVKEVFHSLATQMKDANDPFVHVRREDFNMSFTDRPDGIIVPRKEERTSDSESKKKGYSSYCCSG
ncbi:ras-related protein Rab-13-like isoform X2 [Actinia tenebrosa]|nr:ras-related protein Rab-13-like isoform X2 [Actinia tenebrosa]